MKHFADFKNIYETSIENLLRPEAEKETKKYIRRKKEEAQAKKNEL